MTNQAVTPVTDDKLPVTLVTAGAGRPEDDAVFMRELLDLRQRHAKDGKLPSLGQMLVILGEPPSRKGFWSHRLADPPTRTTFPPEARDAIRRAVGEAPAPPVTEVTERMIDPSAAMHWIGPDTGKKSCLVLMVAPDLGHIEIHANGSVSAKRIETPTSPVGVDLDIDTPYAAGAESAPRPACDSAQNARSVRQRSGVSVSRATIEQNERRQALGRSWQDIIEAGLKALETEV
ncbi:MAG: hypothetical protein KDD89_08615 [Anaerolineales bacterium]|nr:hypothetical protein [Anaerolineales bacterium]